ncbi:putative glycophosphotransferase [Heterostelium album PN500]|uniref:Putative glycophosphotransferase n=1 Tax=Heterostelium pallidum (strain ATCC 26659 / Pp 5 / PN500) TaxID=670386 RepID=D3BG59_HETP5|nr:putative glycophosphotransferase [Heterostelium album PN500]EFA79651.1 putative glycophosphotransferase [Heterostelium album PN500]|eukprot:XP_020431772.1 putative glycophosphotransferase [Heterostelium album PN500]
MKRLHILFAIVSSFWLLGIVVYLVNTKSVTENLSLPDKPVFQCEHIDIVYTWVNGSDPVHIQSRVERTGGGSRYSSPGNNRFRDLMGLKYSLRSLKKYAPWIRRIFVVSDNQYPSWFDKSSDEVRFVFHKDFFLNKEDLPTFNSNSIESNFFNLPDEVSDCFLYFNDDIFVGSPIQIKDFWDPTYGQAIYKSSWTAPQPKEKMGNIWHRCIAYTNELLNGMWGVDNHSRHYASHGANFFNKPILKMMQQAMPEAFAITSSNPFRRENDLQIPFLYLHLRPKTVCLNDGLNADNPNLSVIEALSVFFENYFPERGSWEVNQD